MKRIFSMGLALCIAALLVAGAEELPAEETPAAQIEVQEQEEALEEKEASAQTPEPEETPVVSESPAPTDATEPEATIAPEATRPSDAPAWTMRDGIRTEGTLEELVSKANAGDTIYIAAPQALALHDAVVQAVSKLSFLPDERAFSKQDEEYKVFIYAQNPDSEEELDSIDLTDSAYAGNDLRMTLYLRVERVAEETPQPDDPSYEPEEIEISVEPIGYRGAVWSAQAPSFVLSGIPKEGGYSYSAIVYDERFESIVGDTYEATDEGVYILRFVILDDMGDIVSASQVYTVLLDTAAPEVETELDETGLTLTITAQDEQSGVDAVSLDGGEHWFNMDADGTYSHSVSETTVLPAGAVQVRDQAGNIWISDADITLAPIRIPSYGGGGSASGDGKKAVSHGKGNGKDTSIYDTVALETGDEARHTLVIGGQQMDLTLDLVDAERFDIPDDYEACFTTRTIRWSNAENASDAPDTVVLTAVREQGLSDRYDYRWRFNGEVLRLLNKSGIRYLALEVDGQLLALPTEGFTAGTRYTELKMSGVSTKKFDYSADMRFDKSGEENAEADDGCATCSTMLTVSVEGESYVLNREQGGAMYAYDVYLGPEQMLQVPFGTYSEDTTQP